MSLSYTLDDAIQCPRECQNDIVSAIMLIQIGQAGMIAGWKRSWRRLQIVAAPCNDQRSCQEPTGPVPCPVVPDLDIANIPAVFLVFFFLKLLRHAQCTTLLPGQAFMWECIAITSRSQPRCRPSPATHLEQLCPWHSPVSQQ